MPILNPLQVYQLVAAEDIKRGGNNVSGRIAMTGIVLRESGGNTNAVNTVGNDPPGSRDRGLYQFNDHWNPDVSDMEAFDPQLATAAAWEKSNGYKNFGPWVPGGKDALNPVVITAKGDNETAWKRQVESLQLAIKAATTYGDPDADSGWFVDAGSDGIITVKGDGIVDAPTIQSGIEDITGVHIPNPLGWVDSVVNLIGKIMDPNFWKRIGIAALGVAIIVIALLIIFKDQAVEAAVPGPEINAS